MLSNEHYTSTLFVLAGNRCLLMNNFMLKFD